MGTLAHRRPANSNESAREGSRSIYLRADEEAYLAMRDDEVVVICRGCHYFWHEHGLRPGDPPLTCARGRWKEPQFDTCLACHLAEEAKGTESG